MAFVAILQLASLNTPPLFAATAVPTLSPAANRTPTRSSPAITGTLAVATGTVSITPTRRPSSTPTLTRTRTSTLSATVMPTLSATLSPTLTPAVTSSITATVTASLVVRIPAAQGTTVSSSQNVPAPTRYPLTLDSRSLAIESLRSRSYGGGAIKITRVVSSGDAFKRVLFEYPSEGLRITGMMNIPRGVGPFPVVILDHGYFKPAEYNTGDGTIRAADNFVRSGYLTLAPDYRCYGGSQCGPNPLYVGYAVDVLNLIALLPSLSYADTSRIGIWGHSMGGGISLRVLAISDQIKVGALYGALTGDDEVHYCWLYTCPATLAQPNPVRARKLEDLDPDFVQGGTSLATPVPDRFSRMHEIFLRSSPSRYLRYVEAPIIIHHGEGDDIVPIQWSVDLAESLNGLGKSASLYTYPGEGHVFAGWNWQLFMARTIAFFNEYLDVQETPITVERRVLRQERNLLDLAY